MSIRILIETTCPEYDPEGYFRATGSQSAGFNRMSTLEVTRDKNKDGAVTYKARSSGYGLRAPWLAESTDGTLASALRGLQNHYERTASEYQAHARALQNGRQAKEEMLP